MRQAFFGRLLGIVGFLGTLCLACSPRAGSLPASTGPAPLALVGVTLLDPVHGPSGPSTVVIRGDRIEDIVESAPEGAEIVDASGLYLLPGLWDLHTHLGMADESAPPLLVTQGVIGARDLGGELEEIDALRDRIDSGELLGPQIVRVGPTLNGAQNGAHHRVIDSAESARLAVADLGTAGVDLLKTHNATGREAYFALLDAAEGSGLQVVGHVPTAVSPAEACEAGQASVEHIATLFEGTYISRFENEMDAFLAMPAWLEDDAPALVECFSEKKTLFVPTLRTYQLRAQRAAAWDHPDPRWRYVSESGYEAWRSGSEPSEVDRQPEVIELRGSLVTVGQQVVRLLQDAGAPIGAGTDLASTGILPGFDLHAEIGLLAGAGLTPRQALRAATRGPGPGAGGDPLQGEIVAGGPADLVLLRADAFADVSALESIEAVILGGRLLDRAQLDRVLDELDRTAADP